VFLTNLTSFFFDVEMFGGLGLEELGGKLVNMGSDGNIVFQGN
jgi:hypothetical protein